MAAKRNAPILMVSLLLVSGFVLAGQTIIQKGNIITDVFTATNLFVERVSGHLLKGNIDASNNRVKNLAEPVNPQDAATKAYVDQVAESISKRVADSVTYGPALNKPGSVNFGGKLDLLVNAGQTIYFLSTEGDLVSFDTSNFEWRQEPSTPTQLETFGSDNFLAEYNGKIYVIGRPEDGDWGERKVQVFDTETHQWSTLADPQTDVRNPVLAVHGGRIFLFGRPYPSNTVEVLEYKSGSWESIESQSISCGSYNFHGVKPMPVNGDISYVVYNNKIYFPVSASSSGWGGTTDYYYLSIFNPATDIIETTSCSEAIGLPSSDVHLRGTYNGDGKIYMHIGVKPVYSSPYVSYSYKVVDIETNSISTAGPYVYYHGGYLGCSVGDVFTTLGNKIYLFGAPKGKCTFHSLYEWDLESQTGREIENLPLYYERSVTIGDSVWAFSRDLKGIIYTP